jgi:uncharacterized protein YjdB
VTLRKGQRFTPQIVWPIKPRAAVRWTSSRKAVATVSARGLITGHSPGTARVTATSQGLTIGFNVKVTP